MTGHLGRCRKAWEGDDSTTEEVEIALHEWLHMQEHSYRPMEFLSSCEDRTNA